MKRPNQLFIGITYRLHDHLPQSMKRYRGSFMACHPQLIEREGRSKFVVFSFDEYQTAPGLIHHDEVLRKAMDESKRRTEPRFSKALTDLVLY